MIGINRVLWTTPQFVKDNSVINDNVEDGILRKCISTAEDKYLHPIIGTSLTTAINTYISLYVSSGNTIPTNYKLLIDDYIVPTLLEYTVYEYVPFSYKFRNKGISRQSSPDSIPADIGELSYLRNNIKDTAEFYGERLTTYLRNNSNLFPEYLTSTAGDIQPAKGVYSSNIFIPNANRGGCGYYGYGFTYPINL
jgi:hypothetical protein